MAFTPTEEAQLRAVIAAFESGKTISEIAASTEVFTTDVLEIVQSAVSKKATIAQIVTLVNSELGISTISSKLSGIESGAQVNIIESVKVNSTVLPVYSKSVNITVPTQPSDIGAQAEGNYATRGTTIDEGTGLPFDVERAATANYADGSEYALRAAQDSQGDSIIFTYATKTELQAVETGAEPANVNIQGHISSTSNPHGVTKAQVGLGSVDNTSDTTKNNALVILSNKTIDGGTY